LTAVRPRRATPVTNGTTEIMFIPPQAVNLGTGVVTITHSFTTTVTYVLIRMPG
jgi:hypothetical protein